MYDLSVFNRLPRRGLMNRKCGLTRDMLVIFYCYVVVHVRVLNNVRVGNSKGCASEFTHRGKLGFKKIIGY